MLKDRHQAHWFTAGVLTAVERRAKGKAKAKADYFGNFVGQLVEEFGEPMASFLDLFHARYRLLPLEGQLHFTGPFTSLAVSAPADIADSLAAIGRKIEILPDKRRLRLTTLGGKMYGLKEGVTPEPVEGPQGGAGEEGPSVTSEKEEADIAARPGPCCEVLGCNLQSIQVVRATAPSNLDDEVYVRGALSGGPHVTGSSPYHWPRDSNGDPDTIDMGGGDDPQNPDNLITQVRPQVNDCRVSMAVALTFWEGDWNDFDRALRTAVQQYMSAASAALIALDPLLAPAAGPLDELAEGILDLVGLSDEYMGEFGFAINERDFRDKTIKQLCWIPSLDALTAMKHVSIHEEHDDYLVFRKGLSAHGGEWEVYVKVYMVCP
jgi:hypothetical protein